MCINQKQLPLEFKISSANSAIDSDKYDAPTTRDLNINHDIIHSRINKYSDSNRI